MRAKAFTLIEMLMVLALSAIVVAMVWAVYANMNLFALQFRKRLADSSRVITLDQYLRHDALQAVDLYDDHGQICFQGHISQTRTCYEFGTAFTLRHHALQRDTFMLGIATAQIDTAGNKKLLRLTLVGEDPDASGPKLVYSVHLPATAKQQ